MHTQFADEAIQRSERRSNRKRNGWLMVGSGAAGIVVAVPLVLGWIGKAYDIAKAPDQIADIQRHQKDTDEQIVSMKASQAEIRAGLNRILSAMHLQPIAENDTNEKKETK